MGRPIQGVSGSRHPAVLDFIQHAGASVVEIAKWVLDSPQRLAAVVGACGLLIAAAIGVKNYGITFFKPDFTATIKASSNIKLPFSLAQFRSMNRGSPAFDRNGTLIRPKDRIPRKGYVLKFTVTGSGQGQCVVAYLVLAKNPSANTDATTVEQFNLAPRAGEHSESYTDVFFVERPVHVSKNDDIKIILDETITSNGTQTTRYMDWTDVELYGGTDVASQ